MYIPAASAFEYCKLFLRSPFPRHFRTAPQTQFSPSNSSPTMTTYMTTSRHPYPISTNTTRISPPKNKRDKIVQETLRGALYPKDAPMSILRYTRSEVRILARVFCKDPLTSDIAAAFKSLPPKFLDPTPIALRGVSKRLVRDEGLLPRGSALCTTHSPLNAQLVRSMIELLEGDAEDHVPALLGHVHPRKHEIPGEHSFMFEMSDELLETLKTAENFMAASLVPQEFSKFYRRAPEEKWVAHEPCDACLLTKFIHDRGTLCAILNITNLWNWFHPFRLGDDCDYRPRPMYTWLYECFFLLNAGTTEEVREKLQRRIYTPANEFKALVESAEAAGVSTSVIKFSKDGVVEKEIQRRKTIAASEAAKISAAKAVLAGLADPTSLPKHLRAAAVASSVQSTDILMPPPPPPGIHRNPPPASSVYSARLGTEPGVEARMPPLSLRIGHNPPPVSSVYSFRGSNQPLTALRMPPPPPSQNRQRPPPASSVYSARPFILSPAPKTRRTVTSSIYSKRSGTFVWRLLKEPRQTRESYDPVLAVIDAYADDTGESTPRQTSSFYDDELAIIEAYMDAETPRMNSSKPMLRLDVDMSRQLRGLSMLDDIPPPLIKSSSKPTLIPPWGIEGAEPSAYELEEVERVVKRARER